MSDIHEQSSVPPPVAGGSVLCPGCEGELPAQFRFCPLCGLKMTEVDPAPSTPSSTANPVAADPPIARTIALAERAETNSDPAPTTQETARSAPIDELRCGCGAPVSLEARFCSACGQQVHPDSLTAFRLVARTAQGRRTVHTIDDALTIGSSDVCALRIAEDSHLSREHARVDIVGDRLVLEDLMSSNGTFVRVHQPFLLHEGDEILVGATLLRVERLTAPAANG